MAKSKNTKGKILTPAEYAEAYQNTLAEVQRLRSLELADRLGTYFPSVKGHWYEWARIRKHFKDLEAGEPFIRPEVFTGNAFAIRRHIELCELIVASYPFARRIDQVIFSCYTAGKTCDEIATHLARHRYKPLKKERIRQIINSILREFNG